MTAMADKFNRYGFVVGKSANKIEIKNAVEKLYGVNVESVNTQRYIGKVKTRQTKSGIAIGVANAHKKAIITVKPGETIDFYSNI